jgi:hypothetical protein
MVGVLKGAWLGQGGVMLLEEGQAEVVQMLGEQRGIEFHG